MDDNTFHFNVGSDARDFQAHLAWFDSDLEKNEAADATDGKEVWIDRVTRRICMAIPAKGMAITRTEDRKYWNWISTEESRFSIISFIKNLQDRGTRSCDTIVQ